MQACSKPPLNPMGPSPRANQPSFKQFHPSKPRGIGSSMVGKRFRSYLRAHLSRKSAIPNGTPPVPSDSDVAPFCYSLVPLPSAAMYIRLLQILPPTADVSAPPAIPSDAPLQCRLLYVGLNELPSYLALSYAWGSTAATSSIHVVLEPTAAGDDIAARSRLLRITESLAEALRHLRHVCEGAFFWVDQICIDQGNVAEKNAQVAVMKDIYRDAECVFVWLGPANEWSEQFVERMKAVFEVAEKEGIFADPDGDLGVYELWLGSNLPAETAAARDAFADKVLKALFRTETQAADIAAFANARQAWLSSPWFSRVWVLQEFAVAKFAVLLCGTSALEDRVFTLADVAILLVRDRFMDLVRHEGFGKQISATFGIANYSPIMASKVRTSYNDAKTGNDIEGSLFKIVKQLYGRRLPPILATDPRDRIFAILSLASDARRLGIWPDYSESMTTDVVYTRATRAMIQSTASGLALLEMVRFPKTIMNDGPATTRLPSWVPDFASHSDPIVEEAEWVYTPTTDVREPCLLPASDERILGLRGILVDHVRLIEAPWEKDATLDKFYGYFVKIQHLLTAVDAAPDTGGQPDSDRVPALRIMVGDLDTTRSTLTKRLGLPELNKIRDALEAGELETEVLLQPNNTADIDTDPQARARLERYNQLCDSPTLMDTVSRLRVMANRRPYRTRDAGYVGMGPCEAQPGDVIAIFPGAQTPFVLRPRADLGPGHFELVGETYCHGIMDGEAWGGPLQDFFLV